MGTEAVKCFLGPNYYQIKCGADVTLATFHCDNAGGTAVPFPVCTPEPGETGDPPMPGTEPPQPWPPDNAVYYDYNTGEHVIEQDAFEALHDEPGLLLLDKTDLVELDGGYYQVVAQGALADALGWERGDTLLSLNDYPLRTMADLSVVYTEIGHATSFTLKIRREQSTMMLRYRVE